MSTIYCPSEKLILWVQLQQGSRSSNHHKTHTPIVRAGPAVAMAPQMGYRKTDEATAPAITLKL